jgi:V/A-type H+-transporting ATPase subunit A
MNHNSGTISAISGSLVTVGFQENVTQNELGFAFLGDRRLKCEVVRIRGRSAELQVFEETRGLQVGNRVVFTGKLLSVTLGPGMLGMVYDGLQTPLPRLAEGFGFFLPRGVQLDGLDPDSTWSFEPLVREGAEVAAGHVLGSVQEGIFRHRIMVPFDMTGSYSVESIAAQGVYRIRDQVALLRDERRESHALTLAFDWPVKVPIRAYQQRLRPGEPLVTRTRMIDTFFPIAKGGTYCIPGPFGAGKTVLQQITARNAEVDIVVMAACGERASEVVETLREFPELEDPRTGRSLMERTIIVCNTSAMPVAAREASVYTALTMAEYYREMGLHVLLLADSTSRWAQAMREISGRLEEIPGDEAYPAYLESRIAGFYERAGLVRLYDGSLGSVTIGGTVSPAGGNFEEPVTQSTLKVVGAFHGLSRERANARRFPAVDPLGSWSKYPSVVDEHPGQRAREALQRGHEVDQMMRVVGEEGTALDDFIAYLKSEFLDRVYLQQNAFDPVDSATPRERQMQVFALVVEVLDTSFPFDNKDEARRFFQNLRQAFLDLNYTAWESEEFAAEEARIRRMIVETAAHEEGVQ